MRMLITNQTGYYRNAGKSVPTLSNADTKTGMAGRIMAFSPVLWVLFFALLTAIVRIAAK
jgi:hypothetical protein